MGSPRKLTNAPLIESGLEPEFVITDIVRAEPASDGNLMRLYLATKKHNAMVVQFTVVGSPADFAKMAEQVMEMAGDRNNLALWGDVDEDGH